MPTSGTRLWLILWKAFGAVREHAHRHIQSLGIGSTDFAVLEALLHKGPSPVNAIGSRLRLTSGAATVAIDRLEARNLVRREGDPHDRRARIVCLTPEGAALINSAFAAHEVAMERAVSGLNQIEREQAVKLLKKLGLRASELLKH